MRTLDRLPRFEVATFFVYLLLWPVLTGHFLLLLLEVEFPANIRNDDIWLVALIPELSIGLLPSICLAVIVGVYRRLIQREAPAACLSILSGSMLAGICGSLWGGTSFWIMTLSGLFATAICALLLKVAGLRVAPDRRLHSINAERSVDHGR